MVIFSLIQYFLSFIVSNIRTIPAFFSVCRAKKLAIDLERPFNDLIEEALRDLLKKYEKKSL